MQVRSTYVLQAALIVNCLAAAFPTVQPASLQSILPTALFRHHRRENADKDRAPKLMRAEVKAKAFDAAPKLMRAEVKTKAIVNVHEQHALAEIAAEGSVGISARAYPTVTLTGFPIEFNGKDYSVFNGVFVERPEPQFQVDGKPTFSLRGNTSYYIFYCKAYRVWAIGSQDYWQNNVDGGCVGCATTEAGADVQDQALTSFPFLWDGAKWQRIAGAGVRELGMQASTTFDCRVDKEEWRTAWSSLKKAWCCEKEQLGCEGSSASSTTLVPEHVHGSESPGDTEASDHTEPAATQASDHTGVSTEHHSNGSYVYLSNATVADVTQVSHDGSTTETGSRPAEHTGENHAPAEHSNHGQREWVYITPATQHPSEAAAASGGVHNESPGTVADGSQASHHDSASAAAQSPAEEAGVDTVPATHSTGSQYHWVYISPATQHPSEAATGTGGADSGSPGTIADSSQTSHHGSTSEAENSPADDADVDTIHATHSTDSQHHWVYITPATQHPSEAATGTGGADSGSPGTIADSSQTSHHGSTSEAENSPADDADVDTIHATHSTDSQHHWVYITPATQHPSEAAATTGGAQDGIGVDSSIATTQEPVVVRESEPSAETTQPVPSSASGAPGGTQKYVYIHTVDTPVQDHESGTSLAPAITSQYIYQEEGTVPTHPEAPAGTTAGATPAPTPSLCEDTLWHNCDSGPGGVCYQTASNELGWMCACRAGFVCASGCNDSFVGHTCRPIAFSTPEPIGKNTITLGVQPPAQLPLTIAFDVANVNYVSLVADDAVLEHFRHSVQEAIVAEAQNRSGIHLEQVSSSLSMGSVSDDEMVHRNTTCKTHVVVAVNPPSEEIATLVQNALRESRTLEMTLVADIGLVPGLHVASTGLISVTDMRIGNEESLHAQRNRCSGWSPKEGKWAGLGGSCQLWGWTTPWCYVDANYTGPGHEFKMASDTYSGKFYAPCGEEAHQHAATMAPAAAPAVRQATGSAPVVTASMPTPMPTLVPSADALPPSWSHPPSTTEEGHTEVTTSGAAGGQTTTGAGAETTPTVRTTEAGGETTRTVHTLQVTTTPGGTSETTGSGESPTETPSAVCRRPLVTTNSEADYDCEEGLGDFQHIWTPAKKVWCCAHHHKGCQAWYKGWSELTHPQQVAAEELDYDPIAWDSINTVFTNTAEKSTWSELTAGQQEAVQVLGFATAAEWDNKAARGCTGPSPPDTPATSAAPVATTERPATTAEAPVETTESPATTAEAPVETTESPADTTVAETTSTESPETSVTFVVTTEESTTAAATTSASTTHGGNWWDGIWDKLIYNCAHDVENWRTSWTDDKKRWCCSSYSIGCEGFWLSWDGMTEMETAAATALGYDKDTWEHNSTTHKNPVEATAWDQLTTGQHEATTILGLTKEQWEHPPPGPLNKTVGNATDAAAIAAAAATSTEAPTAEVEAMATTEAAVAAAATTTAAGAQAAGAGAGLDGVSTSAPVHPVGHPTATTVEPANPGQQNWNFTGANETGQTRGAIGDVQDAQQPAQLLSSGMSHSLCFERCDFKDRIGHMHATLKSAHCSLGDGVAFRGPKAAYVELTPTQLGGTMTIAMWARYDDFAHSGYTFLLHFRSNEGHNWHDELAIYDWKLTDDKKIPIRPRVRKDRSHGCDTQCSTPTKLGDTTGATLKNWFHIVLTFDTAAQVVREYLNGHLTRESTRAVIPDNIVRTRMALGRQWFATNQRDSYSGNIRSLTTWDRALTAGDVEELYAATSKGDSCLQATAGAALAEGLDEDEVPQAVPLPVQTHTQPAQKAEEESEPSDPDDDGNGEAQPADGGESGNSLMEEEPISPDDEPFSTGDRPIFTQFGEAAPSALVEINAEGVAALPG
eukprot:TRINITY_DN152_c0_g1_i1.p1 TRINITY_DN152_c0_g1~~TRINITY_DN152_c0_g1_i1.p1  ORF type:complete len:1864 (-),score=301.64 TRINITY_DN152_c0_g1_i1:257-5848(-)